jgi:hypothetical protein
MLIRLVLLLLIAAVAAAQETASLSAEDARTAGLTFNFASGWQPAPSNPYNATFRDRSVTATFATETYSSPAPGAFDSFTTRDALQTRWGDLLAQANVGAIAAGSADGLQAEWPGSRIERWFRISNDRFIVERCMANNVSMAVWTRIVRPACDAQFAAVILTGSTLPPDYRAAEPLPKTQTPSTEFARIPGGRCEEPAGTEQTKISRLIRRGEREQTAAERFACWEAASQLGSPEAMVKIGQLFLDRDQLQASEQDRMAGVSWLLVAADRYQTLIRNSRDTEAKARYQQRIDTIMDLVNALKSGRLTTQQFDTAVTEASNWKKSNMHLFR